METRNELVLKANEVYHDLEAANYDARHPEILRAEADRWRRVGRKVLADLTPPIRLLDYGCGSGFVPLELAPLLSEADEVVCADLSGGMLERCRRNLDTARPACRCAYVKLNGRTDDLGAGRFDVLTLNSVLHHLPDVPAFLARAGSWLKDGGMMIVGHEPSRRFYARRFLRANAALAGVVLAPRRTAGAVLRRLGLIDLARRLLRPLGRTVQENLALLEAVNARLLADGAIDRPLSADELTRLVDVQSPTAGGCRPDRGLDIRRLAADCLPGWEVRELETYNHLGEAAAANRLARRWEARLARRFPEEGATFLAVLRKPPARRP